MALTREFRDTVMARVRAEPRFRAALLSGAVEAVLAGDAMAGRAMLRDLVNATIGFERLARAIGRPSKSVHRMLARHGNPSTESFSAIVRALQQATGLRLRVEASQVRRARPLPRK